MEVSSERRRERRRRLWLFVKNYWHRLVGAAVGWFAWDFYYCEPTSMASTHPCTLYHIECHGLQSNDLPFHAEHGLAQESFNCPALLQCTIGRLSLPAVKRHMTMQLRLTRWCWMQMGTSCSRASSSM